MYTASVLLPHFNSTWVLPVQHTSKHVVSPGCSREAIEMCCPCYISRLYMTDWLSFLLERFSFWKCVTFLKFLGYISVSSWGSLLVFLRVFFRDLIHSTCVRLFSYYSDELVFFIRQGLVGIVFGRLGWLVGSWFLMSFQHILATTVRQWLMIIMMLKHN